MHADACCKHASAHVHLNVWENVSGSLVLLNLGTGSLVAMVVYAAILVVVVVVVVVIVIVADENVKALGMFNKTSFLRFLS